jgi:hypothetical protein
MAKTTSALIAFTLILALAQTAQADSYWTWSSSASADQFESSMENPTDGLLHDNFPLSHWSIRITTEAKFNEIISNRNYLRNFVAKRVRELCISQGREADRCYAAQRYLRKAWVVEEHSGFVGAYRLATVFIDVDEDNWFSFEAVAAKAMDYLSRDWRELRLYKGFNPGNVIADGGIPMIDLPVVIDPDERTITIWTGVLFD